MLPTPSYTFVTSDGQRKFFHRWHFDDNEVIECNKCSTICKETDPFSQHWLKQKVKLTEVAGDDGDDELNTWQKTTIMKHQADIVRQNIASFMLCAGKVVNDTNQFLLDAGTTTIPDLLSVLYATKLCKELVVKLRFYVKIENEMFMLQSSELEIKHYYDIRKSVDVMFSMLLEELMTFMSGMTLGIEYQIKRIYIQVERKSQSHNEILSLPLKYQQKHCLLKAFEMPQSDSEKLDYDLENLTCAFKTHLLSPESIRHFEPPFPCNLYSFQICRCSLELYAVPYHISNATEALTNTRNFIILNDNLGNFQQLQEIGNIEQFLDNNSRDLILACFICKAKFLEPTEWLIHSRLMCGSSFEIKKIHPDFIEIYEKCIEIVNCSKYKLYGIVN